MITDWDDAYDNFGHIPNAGEFPPRWADLADKYRMQLDATGNSPSTISYGDSPRETITLFMPEDAPKGLCVFVHGGYWRAFDPSMWSHLAHGALMRGYAVAMPGYTLAPQARISAITLQVARAIEKVAEVVKGPIYLAGHSAGGHLVSRMICTNSPLANPVRNRIAHVISISGVHDLRPLIATKLNELLNLDLAEARAESPALLEPHESSSLTCWAGGAERPEFIRQNALLANVWTGLGADTRCVSVPGRHHFDILEDLRDPASELAALFAP